MKLSIKFLTMASTAWLISGCGTSATYTVHRSTHHVVSPGDYYYTHYHPYSHYPLRDSYMYPANYNYKWYYYPHQYQFKHKTAYPYYHPFRYRHYRYYRW